MVELDAQGPAALAAGGALVGARCRRRRAAARDATAEPDWAPVLRGRRPLDGRLHARDAARPPPLYADRLAPRGPAPIRARTEPPVDDRGGARDGRVVFWELRAIAEPERRARLGSLPPIAFVAFALMWIGAGFLAHRHLKSGSGDRRGALRLGAVVATVAFVGPLLYAHHTTATVDEFLLVFAALAQGTMFGAIAWLLYMALEPYARRVAPRWIVSWTRLLEGRWKDPMVGRDLLCGLAATAAVNAPVSTVITARLRAPPARSSGRYPHGMAPLRGVLATIANLLHPVTLLVPFGVMAVLVASRALIKRQWPAIAAAVAVVAGFDVLVNGLDLAGLAFVALLVGVGARWGLLALVAVAIFIVNLRLVPVSADPSVWWTSTSWLGWGVIGRARALRLPDRDGAPDACNPRLIPSAPRSRTQPANSFASSSGLCTVI